MGDVETLSDDKAIEKRKELVDDPDLTLIKVTPKKGKLVSLIKIAVAAVTGNHKDGGVERNLHL